MNRKAKLEKALEGEMKFIIKIIGYFFVIPIAIFFGFMFVIGKTFDILFDAMSFAAEKVFIVFEKMGVFK
jgi:hypothetical protein